MSFNDLSNLQQRLIVGSLGIFITFLAIFSSHTTIGAIFFTTFIASLIGIGLWEYYRIAQNKGFHPLFKIGMVCSFAFIFAVYLTMQLSHHYLLPGIVIGLSLIAAFIYYFIKGTDPFFNLPITFFGILYLTIPLASLIVINFYSAPPLVNDGRWCLVYLLLVTKVTDMGAYFIGRRIGHTQLSPYISPKKTWEGALGGVVCSVATSLLFFFIFSNFFDRPPFVLTFGMSIWLALLISIVAQFGDLAESLLKRDGGVKDSSRHFPGLGGFLDSLDSLVFTSPLMYLFLNLYTDQVV